MTWQFEFAHILLDMVSFFLVTVDLYGEERLEHLTGLWDRLFSWIMAVTGRAISKTWLAVLAPVFFGASVSNWELFSAVPPARTPTDAPAPEFPHLKTKVEVVFTPEVAKVLFTPAEASPAPAKERESWWEPYVTSLVGGLMLLPLAGMTLISIAPIIIILGLYAMAAFGLFLLRRVGAKGLLLQIGALLFLAGKAAEVRSYCWQELSDWIQHWWS